jgi:hypothetical protein
MCDALGLIGTWQVADVISFFHMVSKNQSSTGVIIFERTDRCTSHISTPLLGQQEDR